MTRRPSRRHGDPAGGAAGSVVAEGRAGPRRLWQLPVESRRHRGRLPRPSRTRSRRRRSGQSRQTIRPGARTSIRSSQDAPARRVGAAGWRIDASREDTRLATADRLHPRSSARGTAAGVRLRIRLNIKERAVGQALGRFRLSVTSSSNAAAGRRDPGEAATDACGCRVAESHRAAAQGSARPSIAPSRASLKPTRDRIADLQKDLEGARHPDGARDARTGRLRTPVGVRASARQLHGQGRAGLCRRAGDSASAWRRPDAEPARSGALARRRGEPADRARRGQPRLGAVLRPRHRRNQRGLRHAGNTAVAPGAARLAGDGVRAAADGT